MKTGVLCIASDLHDTVKTRNLEQAFLAGCRSEFSCVSVDKTNVGTVDFLIVFVMTGGTERVFLDLWPVIRDSAKPFVLAAAETDNSLPAALEILTWLHQTAPDCNSRIVHASLERLGAKLHELLKIYQASFLLKQQIAGVVGTPSDWLIASTPNLSVIESCLGIKFVSISMSDFKNAVDKADASALSDFAQSFYRFSDKNRTSELARAAKVYAGLVRLIKQHGLTAVTLRCFDILADSQTTGCLALAKINDDGIPAACEGDVPTLVSMMLVKILTGKTCFMANPSRINGDEITMAHCTSPCGILEEFSLDTHFESGIGLAVAGKFAPGKFTLVKFDFIANSYALAVGEWLLHSYSMHLCRTQIKLSVPGAEEYFLRRPLGNHHLLIPGDYSQTIKLWCEIRRMRPVFS